MHTASIIFHFQVSYLALIEMYLVRRRFWSAHVAVSLFKQKIK